MTDGGTHVESRTDQSGTTGATFGMDLHDVAQRGEIERALEDLQGMVAVRLVPGFERPVDELHALVAGDRAPKQVVRDIQSLLYTRFDLSIDHRVISVVQLEEDDPIATAGEDAPNRVALSRVSITQSPQETSVTVVLTDTDGIEHVGQVDHVALNRQQHAAALATIEAVQGLVGEHTLLALAGLELVRVGGVEAALATIDVRAERSQVALVGSAAVRRGDVDAVARAVLDALNRILRVA